MPNSPPASIICLGAATVDTVLQVPRLGKLGDKVMATDCRQFGAGMASSAAASIARLGGVVQIWSRIGDDAGAGDAFDPQIITILYRCQPINPTSVQKRRGQDVPFDWYEACCRPLNGA